MVTRFQIGIFFMHLVPLTLWAMEPQKDIVIEIGTLQKNSLPFPDSTADWAAQDKKIVEYLRNNLQEPVSPDLEQLLLKKAAYAREHHPEQYTQWQKLIKIENSAAVGKDTSEKSEKHKSTRESLEELIAKQTDLHKLYLTAYEEDRQLKQQQLTVLQETNERDKANLKDAKSSAIVERRFKIISLTGTVLTFLFSLYSFLSQKGYF